MPGCSLQRRSLGHSGAIELQSRATIREGIAPGLGVSLFFATECPPDDRIAYRPLEGAMGDYRLRGYLVFESALTRSAMMRTLRTMVSDGWNEPWSVGPVDRPEGQS